MKNKKLSGKFNLGFRKSTLKIKNTDLDSTTVKLDSIDSMDIAYDSIRWAFKSL